MTFEDDRTEGERLTHHVIWAGTDSFMSGWGHASGGKSYAGWACRPQDTMRVERWVRSRSDMQRVREVGNDWRPRAAHTHVYVVGTDHPALC